MSKVTLSICTMTKNEEARIEDFILSVKDIADELVLVDHGSSDNTLDIARRVCQREGIKAIIDKDILPEPPHFCRAINYILKKATMDYIFSLYIDERMSSNFKKEIKGFLERERPMVVAFKRFNEAVPHRTDIAEVIVKNHQNIFCGEDESFRFHQRFVHNYEVKYFPHPIFHCERERSMLTYPPIILSKVKDRVDVTERNDRSLFIHLLQGVRNSWKRFYRLYFKQQLYKDGKAGFKFALFRGLQAFLIALFVGLKPKKDYKYWEDPKWRPPEGLEY